MYSNQTEAKANLSTPADFYHYFNSRVFPNPDSATLRDLEVGWKTISGEETAERMFLGVLAHIRRWAWQDRSNVALELNFNLSGSLEELAKSKAWGQDLNRRNAI